MRPIRIKLIAKMPNTIFIEHSVRIIHPTVGRSMMVGRAVFLNVLCVKLVCICNLLPACEALHSTSVAWIARESYVERLAFLYLKRNEVVNLVDSKAAVDRLHQLVVLDNSDVGILLLLLDR